MITIDNGDITITLRRWELTDTEHLVRYGNNKKIADNMTDAFPHPYTNADARNFINKVSKDEPLKVFAIEVGGEAVGGIGIFPQTDIHRLNAEMGYWLAEKYWGKGIIPLAIKEIVAYGFNTFQINRIYARPFGSNKRSRLVLEKSGFTLEAKLEKTLIKNGELVDEYIYAVRKH